MTDEYICITIQGGVKMFILGSQFMERLESSGYSGVSRWYRKVGKNIYLTLRIHVLYMQVNNMIYS